MDGIYYRRDDLRAEDVVGELIVLDEVNGRVNQLNETASHIWSFCDGHHSVSDIAEWISDRYAVDRNVAVRDVSAVVDHMLSLDLIRRDQDRTGRHDPRLPEDKV